MLGGHRSESGIVILYGASEQGYLVLALLLYYHFPKCYFRHWKKNRNSGR